MTKGRKLIQLLSLGLLLYLLADAFLHIEWAVTKNNSLTSMQKAEVDNIQNIDTVKHKAKEKIDLIRAIHRSYSARSVINFWLLAGIILLQAFLLLVSPAKKNMPNA